MKFQSIFQGESLIRGNKKIIKLSSNESPFKLPKNVLGSLQKVLSESNLYPDGDAKALKEAIAKKFNLKTQQIICGNGSDDILSIVAQTFGREDGEVICTEYGFMYYPIIARAAGAT